MTGVLGLLAVALCLFRLSLGVEGGDGLDVGEDQHCQQQCDSSCPAVLLHLMWSGGGDSCGWCAGFWQKCLHCAGDEEDLVLLGLGRADLLCRPSVGRALGEGGGRGSVSTGAGCAFGSVAAIMSSLRRAAAAAFGGASGVGKLSSRKAMWWESLWEMWSLLIGLSWEEGLS